MRSSESIAALAPALVDACGELENPKATTAANYGKFAPLDELLTAARPILKKHGLVLLQEATTADNGAAGTLTRIVHRSGEWLELGPLFMPPGQTAQNQGSALSYARRYALLAALGLAAEDDDGQAASKTTGERRKAATERRPQRAPEQPAAPVAASPDKPAEAASKEAGEPSDGAASAETTEEFVEWLTKAAEHFGSVNAVVRKAHALDPRVRNEADLLGWHLIALMEAEGVSV